MPIVMNHHAPPPGGTTEREDDTLKNIVKGFVENATGLHRLCRLPRVHLGS